MLLKIFMYGVILRNLLLGLAPGLFRLIKMSGRMVAWRAMSSLAPVVGGEGVFALASGASWFHRTWGRLDLPPLHTIPAASMSVRFNFLGAIITNCISVSVTGLIFFAGTYYN